MLFRNAPHVYAITFCLAINHCNRHLGRGLPRRGQCQPFQAAVAASNGDQLLWLAMGVAALLFCSVHPRACPPVPLASDKGLRSAEGRKAKPSHMLVSCNHTSSFIVPTLAARAMHTWNPFHAAQYDASTPCNHLLYVSASVHISNVGHRDGNAAGWAVDTFGGLGGEHNIGWHR